MAENNSTTSKGGSSGHYHAHKKHGFTGQIGFVMAAAGSAVGVGNLWRFPYLAAKDGGGLFILIYLILTFTFGFTLLTTSRSAAGPAKTPSAPTPRCAPSGSSSEFSLFWCRC